MVRLNEAVVGVVRLFTTTVGAKVDNVKLAVVGVAVLLFDTLTVGANVVRVSEAVVGVTDAPPPAEAVVKLCVVAHAP